MKLSSTSFESNYHNSQKVGNQLHGECVLHNLDVWHDIIINEQSFTAVYQCAMGYRFNDYSCPTTSLEVSEGGGSHPFIVFLDSLCESKFDDEEEAQEALQTAIEYCESIKTVDDLHEVYLFLRAQSPDPVSSYIPDEFQSDDPDDYDTDEGTGYLIPKSE